MNRIFVDNGSARPDEHADSEVIGVSMSRYRGEICGSCCQYVEWHSWILSPSHAGVTWDDAIDCSEVTR